jgi:hypothetical protein
VGNGRKKREKNRRWNREERKIKEGGGREEGEVRRRGR